jgi:hypothetical protein
MSHRMKAQSPLPSRTRGRVRDHFGGNRKAIDALPRLVGRAMTWLGFRYLLLHRSAETAEAPRHVAGDSPPP